MTSLSRFIRSFSPIGLQIGALLGLSVAGASAAPISLHPDNPHYFLYQGKPTILVTSGMHYGAVQNLDVDEDTYLAVLRKHGFNLHREFMEPGYDFSRTKDWALMQSPIEPRPGRLLSPWARSDVPGYVNGGNKFDLDHWNEAYFDRLKEFCRKAERAGVVVELVLFNVMYSDDSWNFSPLNANNNVNGIGTGSYNDYNFLREPRLYEKQKALARKVAEEMNGVDNIYYEICNEPYWAKGIPEHNPEIKVQQFIPEVIEWERGIAEAVVETEQRLPQRHLIAENIANTYHKVQATCHPAVSILNFHYAEPAASLANYGLNRAIAFDETAEGCHAPDRRVEAWQFMMAGGAVYDNLDWSFAVDDMTGLGRNPTGPRQSGVEVRAQLDFLKRFVDELDFIHMSPLTPDAVQGLPFGVESGGLAKPGDCYAIYLLKHKMLDAGEARMTVKPGSYHIQYFDPARGALITESDQHDVTGELQLELPPFTDDLLIKIVRRS